MKKTLSLILTLVLLITSAVIFSSCSSSPEIVFKPTGTVKGTLVLGFDSEYPPYGYLDTETNEYAGFDLDYAKAVCEYMGYTLKIVPIDWDSKDMELESGNIDCIWNGFTINGREDSYEWTCAYVDNSIVVLTTASSGIKTLANLAGKTVTVQTGSSGQSALDDKADLVSTFKNGAYLTCANYTTAFQDLKTGAVDAVVIDIGVAGYLIEGQTGYTILDEKVSSEQYGVGFLKGNTELRDKVEDAMIYIADNTDTVKTLADKYDISDSVIIGK